MRRDGNSEERTSRAPCLTCCPWFAQFLLVLVCSLSALADSYPIAPSNLFPAGCGNGLRVNCVSGVGFRASRRLLPSLLISSQQSHLHVQLVRDAWIVNRLQFAHTTKFSLSIGAFGLLTGPTEVTPGDSFLDSLSQLVRALFPARHRKNVRVRCRRDPDGPGCSKYSEQ